MNSQSLCSSDTQTSVEVLTFNMNKNSLALGDVMSRMKKKTELIIICIQESNIQLTRCQQDICLFFENYECKDKVELGIPNSAKVQMFMLQRRDVHEKFTFTHEVMPFSFSNGNLWSFRPWKGAVFLKCESRKFRRPFVFIGAHFHAHEGEKNVRLRQKDFEQIETHLRKYYADCDWSLFGDLNFRRAQNAPDEFQQYLQNHKVIEHNFSETTPNTYKVKVHHRKEFDDTRIPSRTDRILHNNTENIEIDEYGTVKTHDAPDTIAGAGSDHYPVFETFRIMHKAHISRVRVQMPG